MWVRRGDYEDLKRRLNFLEERIWTLQSDAYIHTTDACSTMSVKRVVLALMDRLGLRLEHTPEMTELTELTSTSVPQVPFRTSKTRR